MHTKTALAAMLAGAATLGLATSPVSAAQRAHSGSEHVVAGDHASHVRAHTRAQRYLRLPDRRPAGAAAFAAPWYGGPFGVVPGSGAYGFAPGLTPFAAVPGSDAYAQGSWHTNLDGAPYQVPYDCAYPIGYDSGGAAIFDRSCPLP